MRINKKIKDLVLSSHIQIRKKIEKARKKRNEKKIRDKIGFEYKDRNKIW